LKGENMNTEGYEKIDDYYKMREQKNDETVYCWLIIIAAILTLILGFWWYFKGYNDGTM